MKTFDLVSRPKRPATCSQCLIQLLTPTLDPDFARDASGCTAVAALVTKEGRVYVVRVVPCLDTNPNS